MEKDVWIGPCVPIAEFYVAMRYVLYVMKNLYKLKSIVPFLWHMVYCVCVEIRPSEPEALERVSISVHSCSRVLLKLGLMALIVYLKYVVCKTYFNV